MLDEVVQLFDQAISGRESKAAGKMHTELAERGKAGEGRQALLDAILAIVADTTIPDEEVGGLIRGDRIGWERLRGGQATALPRLPRDHGHLATLDGSYGYLRRVVGGSGDPARAQRNRGIPRQDPGSGGVPRSAHSDGDSVPLSPVSISMLTVGIA